MSDLPRQPLSPTVAVVGSSARAAAQSARRAGCRVVAADGFADADLVATCGGEGNVASLDADAAGLASWLRDSDADAWLYVGPLENQPGLVDRLAAEKPLWGVAGAPLRRVRQPELLAETVARAGWRTPQLACTAAGLPADGSWLIKRDRSAGGVGVKRWFDDAPPPAGPCHWQQCIDGPSASALFIGYGRSATLLGLTEQLTGIPWCGAAEFHYCGTIAPREERGVPAAGLTRLGCALAEEFELRGLFGVDFVRQGERWYVLEVNPRYTAAVEAWELATGRSALAQHAAAFDADNRPAGAAEEGATDSAPMCVGKAIVFAKHDAVIDEQTSAAWLARSGWGPLGAAPTVRFADIPTARNRIAAGGPVMTVLASGDSRQLVREQLEAAVESVYNQLAQLAVGKRRDALPKQR